MFKPLDLFIGLRYTRSKRENNSISFITLASLLGITLGVLVLITVLSVMNGFQKELRTRILGMVSHVTVTETNGSLTEWQPLRETLSARPDVEGAAPFTEKQVMMTSEFGTPQGVLLQGISPDHQDEVSTVNLPKHMLEGNFQALASRKYGIAIGIELANHLNVNLGDKITVISPKARVTPAGVIPRMKRFTVVAIYQMRLQEYDSSTAFIHHEDAGRLFSMKGQVSGVRLQLKDLFKADTMALELQQQLGDDFKVESWSEDNASLFHAFKMEKIMMYIVLGLIVLVALFNLVASLVMMVKNKQADIAILRTLGMSPRQVARVFMIQGSIVGILGTIIGVILGVLLALNVENVAPFIENLMGKKIFPPEVFYISEIPSDMQVKEVVVIALSALLASIIATIYPARRAANIQPAQSLRYE
ncbi:MAG: Lipoprotein releasing system transmembrane protein LolC [uncultured Thiotrichaceae bacterium]|uniref:Lipoprotein releasing system transmembrane protein LolC n=1 Tax=uncultured Thiotrichaceae bacterium TaxID=298394 RepID=A0A6S6UHR8_9GAMM|nr:MAG: Lipoprotein releasing system transmembrane protein LolC [uncultured Thiotrichaceae bacterium]